MSELRDTDDIDAAIAKLEQLERLGRTLGEVALSAVAEVARGQWAEGQGPTGFTWARTKIGGRIALTSVTAKISITAEANTIRMSGSGLLDWHVRRRRAMPQFSGKLPKRWAAAAALAIKGKVDEIGA